MKKRRVKKATRATKSAKKSTRKASTRKTSTRKTSTKKASKASAKHTTAKKAAKKAAKRLKKASTAKTSTGKTSKKKVSAAVKRTTAVKRTAKNRIPCATPASRAPARVTVREEPITLRIYDMRDVPEHQHFYFVNGYRVRNVKELAEIMDRIEHEVFDYHVNEHRNDFYNWVSGVFKDFELAEKLLGVTGPKHLQFTIYKHVADKALKKRG